MFCFFVVWLAKHALRLVMPLHGLKHGACSVQNLNELRTVLTCACLGQQGECGRHISQAFCSAFSGDTP